MGRWRRQARSEGAAKESLWAWLLFVPPLPSREHPQEGELGVLAAGLAGAEHLPLKVGVSAANCKGQGRCNQCSPILLPLLCSLSCADTTLQVRLITSSVRTSATAAARHLQRVRQASSCALQDLGALLAVARAVKRC